MGRREVNGNGNGNGHGRAEQLFENLLTPMEVARLFRVDPKTVSRWAKAGKLTSIRTLGGHRRFREAEIRAYLEETDSARK